MPSVKCPVCGQEFSPAGVGACPYCNTPLGPEFGFAESERLSPSFPTWLVAEQAVTDQPMTEFSSSIPSPIDTSSLPLSWRAMRRLLSPSRPMRLEGVIVNIQTQQEDAASNLLISILAFLKELIWLSEARTGDQKRTVTVIRLRMHSGIHRDARLDGEPRGALLAVGDNLLLWGHYRKGVFVVRRGFNHTSEAEIYSSKHTTALLASLLIVALLIILFLLCRFWSLPHLPL